jgi:hypothetical protein
MFRVYDNLSEGISQLIPIKMALPFCGSANHSWYRCIELVRYMGFKSNTHTQLVGKKKTFSYQLVHVHVSPLNEAINTPYMFEKYVINSGISCRIH